VSGQGRGKKVGAQPRERVRASPTTGSAHEKKRVAHKHPPPSPGPAAFPLFSLFRNTEELEKLSELGVLFLLFEMGLELSIDRLRGLAKYAFGLGGLQVLFTTGIFACMGLPIGHGLGTEILVKFFHASPDLAAIRTLDEAVVIGAALSLSSSAFVLQLMGESGELATRFGSATLGVLLFQDIAVVPFLVLLPLIESPEIAGAGDGAATASLLASLAPTALKTLAGLGILLLAGRFFLRRVFELVAQARSDETFVALSLLSVTGASLATQRLGFSDTLGAFAAGVLLAETNYRAQVEADIRPFRGILLGLFFVTTGASIDVRLLIANWEIVVALVAGLIGIKIGVIGTFAPLFGLTRAEGARTAFTLAQGGEFAFVLLQLAKELKVLPDELNRLLIIVVVTSMALTPALAELGKYVADRSEGGALFPGGPAQGLGPEAALEAGLMGAAGAAGTGPAPVVICGFSELGQLVANALESPLVGGGGAGAGGGSAVGTVRRTVAFDLNPARVQAARAAGFNCLYGDGSRASVLHAAGVEDPAALVLVYTARARAVSAAASLREAYPRVPIFARAVDSQHAAELKASGASDVVIANVEAGLELTGRVLAAASATAGPVPAADIALLTNLLRAQMDARAGEMAADLVAATQIGDGGGGGGGAGGGGAFESRVFKLLGGGTRPAAAATAAAAAAATAVEAAALEAGAAAPPSSSVVVDTTATAIVSVDGGEAADAVASLDVAASTPESVAMGELPDGCPDGSLECPLPEDYV
jgi:Kef-type K+ transport system membrane component KefB/voltage-gated potassium channel Kch